MKTGTARGWEGTRQGPRREGLGLVQGRGFGGGKDGQIFREERRERQRIGEWTDTKFYKRGKRKSDKDRDRCTGR